jgi:hypothetical protein
MGSVNESSKTYQSVTPNHLYQRDLKIALQSALAAGLCLGLPTGLFFWVLIIQTRAPSTPMERLLNFLREYAVPPVTLEMLGAFGWGVCLSKISGYRQWWWLSAATMAGIRVGDFALYHGWGDQWVQWLAFSDLSLHTHFKLVLSITVLCVTVSTGLLLGLVLMNWKASLMLAGRTGLISVFAVIVTLIILEGLGIRVGSGNIAMPKATAAATMAAALAGGTTLGVVFSRYVRAESSNDQTS